MKIYLEDDRVTSLNDLHRLDKDLKLSIEAKAEVRIKVNGNEYLITPVRRKVGL